MIHEKENSRSDFNPNLGGSFSEILSVLLGYNKQYVDSKAGGLNPGNMQFSSNYTMQYNGDSTLVLVSFFYMTDTGSAMLSNSSSPSTFILKKGSSISIYLNYTNTTGLNKDVITHVKWEENTITFANLPSNFNYCYQFL